MCIGGWFWMDTTHALGEEAAMSKRSQSIERDHRRATSNKSAVVEAPPKLIMLMMGLGMLAGAAFSTASGTDRAMGIDDVTSGSTSALVQSAEAPSGG